MRRWPRLALFLSGLFFGGGMDHLIFAAMKSPTSHYGLTLGAWGQLAFAALDLGAATVFYVLHGRWSRFRESSVVGKTSAN